jgi:hypothetical protein
MAIPGIQEIQALATKYSKPQLEKMARLGLVDPTKAVMAGMMIDRIQQQNMEMPQQTVADEVMGSNVLRDRFGNVVRSGSGQAIRTGVQQDRFGNVIRSSDRQSAGIAGLPSNLPEKMAGGGIVAFADGGDIDDYADGGAIRLAGGGDFRNEAASRVDPRVQASRDKDRYQILLDELPEVQRRLDAGDPRAPADLEALKREIRAVQPRNAVDISLPGISEARAAEPSSLPPIAPAKSNRPKSSTERLMEQQVMEDYGLGPQKISPELKKASEESAARALERQAKQKELRQLEGGFFEQKPLTDEQAARAAQLRQEIESFNKLPPIATPKKETKSEAAPAPAPAPKPAEKVAPKVETAEMGPARPSAEQRLESQLAGLSGKAGKELTPDEVINEQDKMFERLGVNKDFFTNLRRDYESTRGKFQDRADKAAGHALMMFGAGLMGARRGEEFATASKAAQQSLMMYMSSMDKISDQEEKLNKDLRDLAISEENYKRSRATSALETVQKNREKVADRQVQIAELENRGLVALTNAAVEELKARNPAEYVKYKRIAEETGKSIEEVIKMFNIQKSGEISRTTAFKEYNDLIANPLSKEETKRLYPGGFEDYFRVLQGGGAGGGGGKVDTSNPLLRQ